MTKYIDILMNNGAYCAKTIDTQSIITVPWTVFKCQFGCENYGKNYCCPPKVPVYDKTRDIIDCYKTAILFGTHEMKLVNQLILKVNKELFYDGFYKATAFGGGCCRLCEKCSQDGCRFPREAIPSMEACGIDVFATVHGNGFKLKTLTDKSEEYNCYGIILIE